VLGNCCRTYPYCCVFSGEIDLCGGRGLARRRHFFRVTCPPSVSLVSFAELFGLGRESNRVKIRGPVGGGSPGGQVAEKKGSYPLHTAGDSRRQSTDKTCHTPAIPNHTSLAFKGLRPGTESAPTVYQWKEATYPDARANPIPATESLGQRASTTCTTLENSSVRTRTQKLPRSRASRMSFAAGGRLDHLHLPRVRLRAMGQLADRRDESVECQGGRKSFRESLTA
jgi:hypothetical protein